MGSAGTVLTVVVEGLVDESVVKRLLPDCGWPEDTFVVYPAHGSGNIQNRVPKYAQAAQNAPWFILVDLDRGKCAPALVEEWVGKALGSWPRGLCFRVAVRSVEAWLLADREAMAGFLGIALKHVPTNPEQERDPKRRIGELARKSRRRGIRDALAARPESVRAVGPGYVPCIQQFVREHWNPNRAAEAAPSLRRAVACLEALRQVFPLARTR